MGGGGDEIAFRMLDDGQYCRPLLHQPMDSTPRTLPAVSNKADPELPPETWRAASGTVICTELVPATAKCEGGESFYLVYTPANRSSLRGPTPVHHLEKNLSRPERTKNPSSLRVGARLVCDMGRHIKKIYDENLAF
jgi:hypothetical protein